MTRPPTSDEIAAWIDEEHRLECMVPSDRAHPESYAMIALAERRATLAEMAAVIRQWSETGEPPRHRPVRQQWRTEFLERGNR